MRHLPYVSKHKLSRWPHTGRAGTKKSPPGRLPLRFAGIPMPAFRAFILYNRRSLCRSCCPRRPPRTIFLKERMRTVLGIAGLALEYLHDRQDNVQADQIARAPAGPSDDLRRASSPSSMSLRRCNAVCVNADGFVDHRDQDAVYDKAGGFLYLYRGLADLFGDRGSLRSTASWSCVEACNDLDQLHNRSRVEEVHANHVRGQCLRRSP